MSMKVNYTGRNTTNSKNNYSTGAKIGAGVGLAAGLARTYAIKDLIKQTYHDSIELGKSKGAAKVGMGLGFAITTGLFIGTGALIGAGVQKLINHYKKDKTEQPENPLEPKTIKTKKDGEFLVVKGHPKTVYKKNPETGEFEMVTQVYDGSWGKEISDKDLIKVLTTKVK
ncbi:hypothetical protein J6O48_06525 [bacterium]|nr:hypothetical protein [bacterium]